MRTRLARFLLRRLDLIRTLAMRLPGVLTEAG